MVERKDREFFVEVMRYMILIGVIIWVLRNPFIFDFQVSFRENSAIDFSFLRWPLVSFISGFFLGRIAERVLVGDWIRHIKSSLRLVGGIGFVYLLMSLPQSPESLRFNSTTFLTGAIMIAVLNLGEKTVGKERQVIGYSLRALYFVSFGFFSSRIISRIPEIGVEGLDYALLVVGLLTGVVSLSGAYEGNLNEYASYIGKNYGNRIWRSFFLILAVIVYALVYRNRLVSDLGTSSGFVLLLEWGVVSILGYNTFRKMRKSVSVSTNQRGNWKEHVQALERRSERGLDKWSMIVDDFIKRGDKTLLVVYLVELLRRNQVSLERIRIELDELMNWNDKGVHLGLVFNEDKKRQEIEGHRRMAVNRVIDRIQERIG